MKTHQDFLVEIHTEELPPKSLLLLSEAFAQNIRQALQKAQFEFNEIKSYATPRRLAVIVQALTPRQPNQIIERRGPAWMAAFNTEGKPTPACLGFARSLNISAEELTIIETDQGKWVGYKQTLPGKLAKDLLPSLIEQALRHLPVQKWMRWGEGNIEFVRPVHAVTLLLESEIIPGNILGCEINQMTRGHRFLAGEWFTITAADQYESLLKAAYVLVDFELRKKQIQELARQCIEHLPLPAKVLVSSDALLNEITGLVEWPTALCGRFEEHFLSLPPEILIAAMEDHQRYFPVIDARNQLLPYFITISNIISNIDNDHEQRVIQGNERVLRARLADAAFFYAADQKQNLSSRLERLKNIVYQAKLGSLYDKSARLATFCRFIATQALPDLAAAAERAGSLAKCDLESQMVGEFPNLQGIMGYYYALRDGENEEVAIAIKTHYQPRFSKDTLPTTSLGLILALADRVDTLTGAFAINQIPSGDKDPFGLRRAAIGILRILLAGQFKLDLRELFLFSIQNYAMPWHANEVLTLLLTFMQERARFFYQEQGIAPDIFAAVAALSITEPLDFQQRVHAVSQFKHSPYAEKLSIANKRVSHLLAKQLNIVLGEVHSIDPTLFEHPAETALFAAILQQEVRIKQLTAHSDYHAILLQLAELHTHIDHFFDNVMVLCDNQNKRDNRLLLLAKLRELFLQVADIALLQ